MSMATAAAGGAPAQSGVENTRFFTIMACAMCLTIVAGFSVQLGFGRSSFAVPWPYHLHGVLFFGWVALYLAQHFSISAGNKSLHARLGKTAYLFIPAMLAAGTYIMVVVAQRNGGPFFFNKSEFLWSNIMVLWCFGGLAYWALKQRRYTGWHRRLMLCAMAILTGPGLGRLLPAPLFIPNSWLIITLVTFIWPVIGMIADKRSQGRVHTAYWWGLGAYVATFAVSMALAYSPIGYAVTDWIVAGTPGAERPMEPFLPEGFSM